MIHDLVTPTNGVAVASVVSPLWLQYLTGISEVATVLLPIMGVTWLGIQMYTHFKKGK